MVTGRRSGDLAATIRAGNFEIISGVLPDEGGTDDGPNPHRLLEAALASCTVITVQMYANRKGWPLKSTNVAVNIVKEDVTGTSILREISFDGDLSEEQRGRLFDIANKCPLHKLLMGKIEIESRRV